MGTFTYVGKECLEDARRSDYFLRNYRINWVTLRILVVTKCDS